MQGFKDCLRIAWAAKQMQYSSSQHLVRINLFQNDSNKWKCFYRSSKGNARWMFSIHQCRSYLFCVFAAGILWNESICHFCKNMYSQMHRTLQPWWLFGRGLLYSVLQVDISHPHIKSNILFAEALRHLQRMWLQKFLFGRKLTKYAFLCCFFYERLYF